MARQSRKSMLGRSDISLPFIHEVGSHGFMVYLASAFSVRPDGEVGHSARTDLFLPPHGGVGGMPVPPKMASLTRGVASIEVPAHRMDSACVDVAPVHGG